MNEKCGRNFALLSSKTAARLLPGSRKSDGIQDKLSTHASLYLIYKYEPANIMVE
jgi:hypothetical protein